MDESNSDLNHLIDDMDSMKSSLSYQIRIKFRSIDGAKPSLSLITTFGLLYRERELEAKIICSPHFYALSYSHISNKPINLYS